MEINITVLIHRLKQSLPISLDQSQAPLDQGQRLPHPGLVQSQTRLGLDQSQARLSLIQNQAHPGLDHSLLVIADQLDQDRVVQDQPDQDRGGQAHGKQIVLEQEAQNQIVQVQARDIMARNQNLHTHISPLVLMVFLGLP